MAEGYQGIPAGPLSAWLGVKDRNQQLSEAGDRNILVQLHNLQQIQEMQRVQQFRAAFEALPPEQRTPENLARLAAQFSPAKDVFHYSQQSLDRQATRDAAMQMGLMRLSQADLQHRDRIEVARRNATTAEGRAAVDAYARAYSQWRQGEILALQRGEASYSRPPEYVPQATTPPSPGLPTSPAAPQQSGRGATIDPRVSPADLLPYAGTKGEPDALEALSALQAGRFSPSPATPAPARDLASLLPAAAPPAQPQPAPQAPVAPNLRSAPPGAPMPITPGTGPVISSNVPLTPTAPKQLTLADAPADLAPRDKAKWLLQQTKPSIYGAPGTLVNSQNSNLHGQEFLATLPPSEQNVVKTIAGYEAPLNQVSSLRTQARQEILAAVKQYDPNFSMMKYPVRQAIVTDFAKGKTADNIVALDQAINHMGTLWKLGDALQNNDLKALNAVVNFVRDQTGDPRVNNFTTAKQAVGTELMRVFRQVQASEIETQAWERRFSDANSPQQIKGAIQVGSKLLEGRINALNNRWNRGMETTGGYPQILSPEANSALQMFMGGKSAPTPATAPAASGWKVERVN